MNPAQSALYLGQARGNSTNGRRIGCNAVPGALDDARESQSRIRHNVNVRRHPRLDVFQLRLAEIRKHPPDASVDQRKALLPYVSIGALRNDEVGDPCIEGSVDTTLIVVVLSVGDSGDPPLPLGDQGIQGQYAGLRLLKLRRALL